MTESMFERVKRRIEAEGGTVDMPENVTDAERRVIETSVVLADALYDIDDGEERIGAFCSFIVASFGSLANTDDPREMLERWVAFQLILHETMLRLVAKDREEAKG
jgi:hypothetical protein